jgi:hypothetical protein
VSCQCGAVLRANAEKLPVRDKDRFDCPAGRTLGEWNGSRIPTFEWSKNRKRSLDPVRQNKVKADAKKIFRAAKEQEILAIAIRTGSWTALNRRVQFVRDAWLPPEGKQAIAERLANKIDGIAQAEEPFLQCRMDFVGTAIAYTDLQVLCLLESENAEVPHFRCPYISGKLHRHIRRCVPHNETSKQHLWSYPDSEQPRHSAPRRQGVAAPAPLRLSRGDPRADFGWVESGFPGRLR